MSDLCSLPWLYGLNLVINSLLTFSTLDLLVAGWNWLAGRRCPLPRLFLWLPMLQILTDPFRYRWDSWALFHQINPLEAAAGSRMIIASLGWWHFLEETSWAIWASPGLQLCLLDGITFSIADLLALALPAWWPPVLVCGVLLITFLCILKTWRQLKLARMWFRDLQEHAIPYLGELRNQRLAHAILRDDIQILISDEILSPCAFRLKKKSILLPKSLLTTWSPEELDAVLAHEWSHLRHHDGLWNAASALLSSCFWWVPTRWWTSRLEEAQEVTCDRMLSMFEIPSTELAAAILKLLRTQQPPRQPLGIPGLYSSQILKRRVALLLNPKPRQRQFAQRLRKLRRFLLILGGIFLFSGRYWIF